MSVSDSTKKIQDVIDAKPSSMATAKTKEEWKAAFWRAAIEVFNEDIAGDVTLIDGRVIHTPKIEL